MNENDMTPPTDADLLVAIAEEIADLSRWQSRVYVTLVVNSGYRTLPVGGTMFQSLLRLEFRKRQGRLAVASAIKAAITALKDIASTLPEEPVSLRTAAHKDRVYLDLADDTGRAIEISASGWRVVDRPPVKFVRSDLTLPLPMPAGGGRLDDLRQFLNLAEDGSFQLLVTYCIAALMPNGPYPVLAIGGEQGSSKTTTANLIHELVDPSRLPYRALPRSERDLFIGAMNAHLHHYDNISGFGEWLSDIICKLSTGAGMSTRALFTDDGEVYFQAIKPVILNGIEDVVKRADLADRSIILNLPAIAEEDRMDYTAFWARFHDLRPKILGKLLDLMALALARLPTLETTRLPRMAGFARLGIAIEDAFGEPGCFLEAYDANRTMSASILAESDPLVSTIAKFASNQPSWRGTAADLSKALESWMIPPRRLDPAALGGRLRRIAPILRTRVVSVEFDRSGKDRIRYITISKRSA